MEIKVVLLLAITAIAVAAPSKRISGDLSVSEGRHIPTYSASYGSPSGYAHHAAPKYGSASVTSYNRRGSYAQANEYAKPSIYGSSYGAQPSILAPAYSSGPSEYAPGHASPIAAYPAAAPSGGYGGYGPQTNAYSAQSQLLSQDPSYDSAKDPVSQYAAYIPNKEYAPKSQTIGNELSLYGYRK